MEIQIDVIPALSLQFDRLLKALFKFNLQKDYWTDLIEKSLILLAQISTYCKS